jgi:hypothetical protein
VDFASLKNALKIADGKVTIGIGTLTPNIDKLINDVYGGNPIVLSEAAPADGNADGSVVAIGGRSSLLNAENVGVGATFVVDESGNAQALLRYTLIDGQPADGGWKFSKSFPSLPTVVDWSKQMPQPTTIPLDGLNLSNASFVISSRAQQDPVSRVDLQSGINFVGDMKIDGIVGQIESLIGSSDSVKLHGAIRVPASNGATQALGDDQYPWAVPGGVAGILLQALLGHNATFGKLVFGGLVFRIYSPTSQTWLEANPSYSPVLAYTGQLSVPSASLTLDVAAELAVGATDLLIAGNFTGFSIANLASLADIAGSNSLITSMPDQIKSAGDILGQLEVTHASLGLDLNLSAKKFEVTSASVTVGMPNLKWQVFENHFVIDSIVSSFSVTSPFDSAQRQIAVSVFGKVEIEGVLINITSASTEQFTVYTELGSSLTIPLKDLMMTYVPGVPPPSDLTVNTLSLSIAPQKQYSMAVSMAQEPNPWTLPLGPTTLTVSDVSLYFIYPQGGPLGGSFSGTIALGSVASMSMTYTIPGSVVLNASLPRIGLTDLAREVAGATSLPFPAGFPDISLVDSSVRFSRDSSSGSAAYAFLVRSTASVGGTAGLNLGALIAKSGSQTGFAVGIWTPKWAPEKGWSPGSLWQPLSALEIDSAGLVISTLTPDDATKGQLIPLTDVPALSQDKFKIVGGVTFFATLRLTTGSVSVLRGIFGDSATFDLYASYEKDTKTTTLIAHLSSGDKSAFAFSDIDLIWESVSTVSASISLSASGRLSISGEQLDYSVTGKISTDGTARLALNVRDWVHPFGYDRLIVKNFGIAIALADGVVISLQGTFQFTTKQKKDFLFGVAGAILDFEAPSALAFQLASTSPGQTLRIGEILEGVTTIDIYDLPPGTNVVPWILEIKLLDLFLEIKELAFWAVVVDEVEIGGVTYKKGFGIRGLIALFGVKVSLYLEVRQAEKMFAGSAEFPDEVRLGEVLLLSRPSTIDFDSKRDLAQSAPLALTPKGPVLAVSSQIDTTHKYYLYVAAHLQFFDIFRADILGQATDDGVAYVLDLQAGTSGQGAWAAQRTTLLVSREQLAFSASLAYDFGLNNVTLGGFDLFGTLPIPAVRLPDFRFAVNGNIGAGLLPPKFGIGGGVKFQFMGLDLDESFQINLELTNAPKSLGDFGAILLAWIKENLENMLKSVLDVAQKFADWVKENFEKFKNFANQVAQVLKDVFNEATADAVKALMAGIGWAADVVSEAVDTAYKICAMTQALVSL